ncbi:CRM-domain containing factor CFM2, chloroplastic isoform X2 [Ricinus communis]|uniref:CRM-domain containing factor CFM2, chloroplastic isoform X2 n=1 Tax=Ricinus communis TaxID=3988 RepID=UPI000772A4BE|nr:CRM-domain containing factor CFM2, chloroplastic isoform X2 [Ricinus communis]|eukprot:XP_015573686.1 CRM-domain containing factor CFM2, chloroplastic isoform X2 [Ricinus communis]
MLLSLHLLSPSPPLRKPYSPVFPFPQTLILQNRKVPSKSSITIHCSNSKTVPSSAIQRIADKLRSLGFAEHNPEPHTRNSAETKQREGEIFIPLPNELSKYRVGHTLDPSWSTPENPVPRPGSGNAILRYHELRKQVKKEREDKKREAKVPTLAELSLSEEELRRLRRIGIAEKRKLKVGKAGITEGIVNGIHERWRRSEVVKIVCEDLCRMNMKRTHDLLERKTGGLVVWRAGSKIVLYRGVNYIYPYFLSDNTTENDTSIDAVQDTHKHNDSDKIKSCSSSVDGVKFSGPSPTNKAVRPALIQGVGLPNRVRFQLPGEAQLAEEVDSLLEGLGPRFSDWWGYEPLPVDADLLPAIVPGYQKPFRLLPYGIKPILTNDEMTTLKRLGRPLPCHFVLGRNRKLQGLAASIIKLWEKCEIAKIAVKRGVQNTNSEMMAEELKRLTGGTLLSRDREFIVLYRGKDFLPSAVSSAIKERRNHVFNVAKERTDNSTSAETAKEAEDVEDGTSNSGSQDEFHGNNEQSYDLSKQRKLSFTKEAIKRTSIRLSMALEKKAKAVKLLAEIENSEMSQQPEIDKEGITDEERYMLRKVGLKMKPFLLIGRRGVFDGTIENMHLHWKYRELVKIICKERSLNAVHEVAQSLEAESGGILVAVERVSKGYAIVVYRGKNYQRPALLRPPTLLSKREAMKRSLEAQRRESLKLHVLRLTRNINDLKLKLAKDEEAHNAQSFDEVKEQMHSVESAIHVKSDSELNSDNHSFSGISSHCKENVGSEERGSYPCVSAENCVHENKIMGSTVESTTTVLEESVSISANEDNEMQSSTICLSNRDRLMLRKQALKMKNRPVLAVGRSNIVTGVAKTIKAHFKKYPLAIVNVKGRAKGTSVQEVVFQLEQATGGVLVSQEPSKVILYRGWGAFDEPGHRGKKNAHDSGKTSVVKEESSRLGMSPELMAAIRLECGLQNKQEQKQTPLAEI